MVHTYSVFALCCITSNCLYIYIWFTEASKVETVNTIIKPLEKTILGWDI